MKYGLIGEKLSHSYSVKVHNLLGNNEYDLCELEPEKLDDFMRKKNFVGINITIPYKEKVLEYCELSPIAKKIGAINTIVNRDGKLYGYNTDYFGFLQMARRKNISFKGMKVVILGTGGTSKTVTHVVVDEGAKEIVLVGRNPQIIKNIQNDKTFPNSENSPNSVNPSSCVNSTSSVKIQNVESITYKDIEKHYDAEIVINTTPVGMYPNNEDDLLIDLNCFYNLKAAMDVIYNPMKTNFLLERHDIKTSSGIAMIVGQAIYSHNLFEKNKVTCASARDSIMLSSGDVYSEESLISSMELSVEEKLETIIFQLEKEISNYVLVGMPGSGKTTIGRKLANILNMKFVDTDEKILELIGEPPEKIIKEKGEEEFRKIESEIIAKYGKLYGQVIATGGGSVLLKENRKALGQNGKIFFVERDIEKLHLQGRPLSSNIQKIYNERIEIYRGMAEYIVDNCSVENAVNQIVKALKM